MIRRLTWLATHGRWNPGWRRRLAELEGLSRATQEALGRWQAGALAKHVAWAVASLPYYRECVHRMPQVSASFRS